jgi:hypothetical protein
MDIQIREPCASCGEETAVGSVHFTDRTTFPRDGQPDAYLCGLCFARMRAAGKPERLSEQDVIALERLQSAGNQVFFRF